MRALRVISVLGATTGLVQVLLHSPPLMTWGGAAVVIGWVIGVLQVLVFAAMGWWAWWRPAMTGVDGDGLHVRAGTLALQRIAWSEVGEVRPPGRGAAVSSVLLRDGRSLTLPGVDRADGVWLAELATTTRRPPSEGGSAVT